LPNGLADMTTPRRTSTVRCTVTANSRTTMITTAHQGSSWFTASTARLPMISSLSASGSASCPNRVMPISRRATHPSIESVSAAKTKTPNAHQRASSPSANTSAAITGTSSARSIVNALARLTQDGSGLTTASSLTPPDWVNRARPEKPQTPTAHRR
jgi:hypothetical protein